MNEYEFEKKIMGCDLVISIISESKEEAEKYFLKCYDLGLEYEKIFSRFIPHSELSKLNEKKDLVVSEKFWRIFKLAQELFYKSDEKFNPSVQIEKFGYDESFDLMKKEKTVNIEIYETDFAKIIFSDNNRRIILKNNQKLDMGGFLKGYVAEKMSKILENFSGSIVNLGGDIYTRGRDINNQKFIFSIYNPLENKDVLEIPLENSAIATSGNYKRKWKNNGVELSHILDSGGTKISESDLISATVISSDGATADAFATVLMTMKKKEVEKFCNKNKIKCVLIFKNGEIIIKLFQNNI